jgi:anti-anti-sigma factor
LRKVLNQGGQRFVLDLTDVRFMDRAAIAVMARARRRLPGPGRVVVWRPCRNVLRLLALTEMDGPCLIES